MPRNRNKYRRQSLTEVRVNGQDIRISPYLAQYTAKGKGEAEHVRQMTELVCVTRPVPVIADQVIAFHQVKRDPVATAIREKLPSTNPDPSLSTNAAMETDTSRSSRAGHQQRHAEAKNGIQRWIPREQSPLQPGPKQKQRHHLERCSRS